ncbi:hypothetical protein GEMRC1_001611 [Eukaryota sp. GEM-RC1]
MFLLLLLLQFHSPDFFHYVGEVVQFYITHNDKVVSSLHNITLDESLYHSLVLNDVVIESMGRHTLQVECLSTETPPALFSINTIPGILTILPQILIISLAIITKQVIPSLFIGIVLASTFIWNFNPINGIFKTISHYCIVAIIDPGHAKLTIFFVVLGGLIGTGLAIRPVLAKLRVSPAKIAYLLDALASPISSIAVISSWIGFQVSLLRNEIDLLELDYEPFLLFVRSIPYTFYPLMTIIFVLLNIFFKA